MRNISLLIWEECQRIAKTGETMFKPGDILRHKDKNIRLKVKVVDIDIHNWYTVEIVEEDNINFPYHYQHGRTSWPMGYMFDYEQDIKPIELDNIQIYEPVKIKEHECECGAYKAGYTKRGRAHSYYCEMSKEE